MQIRILDQIILKANFFLLLIKLFKLLIQNQNLI